MRRRRLLFWSAAFCLGLSAVLFGIVLARPKPEKVTVHGYKQDRWDRWDGRRMPDLAPPGTDRTMSVNYLLFSNPEMEERFHRIYASLNRLARSGEPVKRFINPSYLHDRRTHARWDLPRDDIGGWLPDPFGRGGSASVSLQVNVHKRTDRFLWPVTYFTVFGEWKPDYPSWHVWVHYTPEYGPPLIDRMSFRIRIFRNPNTTEAGEPQIEFVRHGRMAFGYGLRVPPSDPRFSPKPGTVSYDFEVYTPDPDAVKLTGSCDEEFLSAVASPEAFRNYGVRVYESLGRQIEADFASGNALRRSRKTNDRGESVPTDRKLTDEEKQRALDEARRWVRARLDAINTDYREMHAAVMRAFPLTDCLRPEKTP